MFDWTTISAREAAALAAYFDELREHFTIALFAFRFFLTSREFPPIMGEMLVYNLVEDFLMAREVLGDAIAHNRFGPGSGEVWD